MPTTTREQQIEEILREALWSLAFSVRHIPSPPSNQPVPFNICNVCRQSARNRAEIAHAEGCWVGRAVEIVGVAG